MARVSTIRTHPQVERIERAIAEGVPSVDIARRYGVSESAVARHKKSRLNALAAVLDDDNPPAADILVRVSELADSATRSRKLADISGSAAQVARAQATELAALNTLIDRLGITDTTVVELAQGALPLVGVVQRIAERHPSTRADIDSLLRADEALEPLADQLAALLDGIKK